MAFFSFRHFAVLTGTIGGGLLGFYIKHKLELYYEEKWRQEMLKHEKEKLLKESKNVDEATEILSDS